MLELNKIYCGDSLEVLKTFPNESIDCCVTSPPYWGLRNYQMDDQLGLEPKFEEYIKNLQSIFNEIYRILKNIGTCFVNLGDTYGGSGKGVGGTDSKEVFNFATIPKVESEIENKCLVQIPSRFALAMCDNGWVLRNELIWHKPNSMPTSAIDRFTVDFEKIFFFVKQQKYYFEQQLEPYKNELDRWGGEQKRHPVNEKTDPNGKANANSLARERDMRPNKEGKNMRTVWSINTEPFPEAHFATYPELLVNRMIKAGCPENGIVLDPFMGAGTTGLVARKLDRNYVGIELNPKYIEIANKRIKKYTSRGTPFFKDSEIKEI